MLPQSLKLDSENNERTSVLSYLPFIGIFSVYLILRGLVWKKTILIERTDSVHYLLNIKTFLMFDLQQIINLSPDVTPFYPFFGALFTLPGWSVETGARLASLVFSCALFVAVLGIGKRITNPLAVALGLLILSFSPILIPLSFSILTEPSYVATIYLGLWFFWTQYKEPKFWKAGVLGVIFGLAFLNRLEGFLYLCIIPFFQGAYHFWQKPERGGIKHILCWSFIFITFFSLMAIPQVWRVSHKMGVFALNGRQAWSLLINTPDGKSGTEKIFGLDFSPSEINIKYIRSHSGVMKKFDTKVHLFQYRQKIKKNFDDLYQNRLGVLIGPLGLIFFGFGILSLYQSKRRFEVFLILSFIILNLAAPFLHDVGIRHILVIAPIIFLTAGIGVVYLSRALLQGFESYSLLVRILPFIFLLVLIGAWYIPLVRVFNPPDRNKDYSPAELRQPIAFVKNTEEKELKRPPIIASQRTYLAFFTGGEQLYLPYTDYKGLVIFCDLNNVDFLYLKHEKVKKYPFFHVFLKEEIDADFILVYRGTDAYGKQIELYRFRKKERVSS